MINDRRINLSVGNSRRSMNWEPVTMLLSEFYKKLQTPFRSSETLAEYLNMKRAEQDELKDAQGGYVCGTLKGPRRKASSVTGRDVITLDLDNIPPGGTEDVLRRIEGVGVNYCVYSTRKHHAAAPRLRVLIPFDRAVSADEYEPCARRVAGHIGIEMADPTTFEAARLMYWPSCCSDSQYVYYWADKPFVSADGVLAEYADWRDVSLWPSLPGAQAFIKSAVKQGDPESKKGVVGAFCRAYDVYRVIDELLPGLYEPVGNASNRYTYLGGSTIGGAVVYDGGKFLYSHHATDPCGGKLVNAFDLTRLHRFGELDDADDVRTGTPTTKLPSYLAMSNFVKELPECDQLLINERGEEIKRDFSDAAGVFRDENLTGFLGGLKGEILTAGIVRGLLSALNMSTRVNDITRNAEITGCPPSWPEENVENLLPIPLLDYLKLAGSKGANKSAVCDYLDFIAMENHFNPVIEMLKSVAWDGADRLLEACQILNVSDPFYQTLIFKWKLQCVALVFNNYKQPYGADGVLVLQGPQRMGKTSYFREIVPIPSLFKEGADIDPRNKDTIMEATSRWICELGEIDKLAWRDQASLKAFLTAAQDEYRTPYARKAIKPPRRTSFCGTVNPDTFLVDDTGNQRYWTVPVQKVDKAKLFSLTQEWKVQLWAQTYRHYLQNPQGFRLTDEERALLDQKNQSHTKPMEYELEARELFNYGLPVEKWGEFTAAELAGRMMPRPPARRLGRVLAKLGREDERIQIKKIHGVSVYRLPVEKFCPLSTPAFPPPR